VPVTPSPPLPEPGPDAREFWDGCGRHELRLRRCADCARARFAPRPACPWCGSLAGTWFTASGRGRVFTWTVVHRPTLPAFEPLLPYVAVLVELDEGPFLVGRLRGCDPAAPRAGLAVRVEFEDVGGGVSLPHWRVA
jgi:uncharacterized OB-fold protein